MTNPIAAALGAQPGETLEDAARRVVGERDELRRVIDHECPIGAFDLATTWRAERALLQDEAAELRAAAVLAKEAWQRGEATRRAQSSHIEQLRGVLADVSEFLGDPVDAEDAYTRNLIERVRRFL